MLPYATAAAGFNPAHRRWMDHAYWIRRVLGKQSSLQIIMGGIMFHSLLSFFLIYWHVLEYISQQERGQKYEPYDITLKNGGLSFATRSSQINLLSQNIFLDDQSTLDHNGDDDHDCVSKQRFIKTLTKIGWRESYHGTHHASPANVLLEPEWRKWIECFNYKHVTCSQIISTECDPHRIHAIHQFLPITAQSDHLPISEVDISARAMTDGLLLQHTNATFGLTAIIELNSGKREYMRMTFPADSEKEWIKRTITYVLPPLVDGELKIASLMISLDCFGYRGKVSYGDIQVIPKPDPINIQSARHHLISYDLAHLNHYPRYSNENLRSEVILDHKIKREIRDEYPQIDSNSDLALVGHMSWSQVSESTFSERLSWAFAHWTGPASLVVFIPRDQDVAGNHGISASHVEDKKKRIMMAFKDWLETHPADVTITAVWPISENGVPASYPLTSLINIALQRVTTSHYLLLSSLQLQPNMRLRQNFRSHQSKSAPSGKCQGNHCRNVAILLPSFQFTSNTRPQLSSKADLMYHIHKSQEANIVPLRYGNLIDYWKWYHAGGGILQFNASSCELDVDVMFRNPSLPYALILRNEKIDLEVMSEDEEAASHSLMWQLRAKAISFNVMPDLWLMADQQEQEGAQQEVNLCPQHYLMDMFSRFITAKLVAMQFAKEV